MFYTVASSLKNRSCGESPTSDGCAKHPGSESLKGLLTIQKLIACSTKNTTAPYVPNICDQTHRTLTCVIFVPLSLLPYPFPFPSLKLSSLPPEPIVCEPIVCEPIVCSCTDFWTNFIDPSIHSSTCYKINPSLPTIN